MRADRLLSLLMLIQARGKMTVRELAEELEVSERTIYRDITALSTSGVPVYALRGPGGGVRLIEEYRTTLTGLTPDETRALFMLSIPAPLMQLGMGEEFKGALLKLSASLPASRRADEARTRQRIHLDSSWWFQSEQDVPYMHTVQQALFQDRRLHIKVRWNFFNTELEQEAEPYGLVAKANVWYLVYGRGGTPHVTRVRSSRQSCYRIVLHVRLILISWNFGRAGAGNMNPSRHSWRGYESPLRLCPCWQNMSATVRAGNSLKRPYLTQTVG